MNEVAEYIEHQQSRMMRWAYRFTSDSDDARDLVQTTCLKALEGRFVGGSVGGWLYVIMRNAFLDGLRESFLPLESVTLSVEMGMDRLDVEMALSNMSDKIAKTMRLYAEGYTTEEISSMMGCREGTVSSRVHNGKRQLRETLYGRRR